MAQSAYYQVVTTTDSEGAAAALARGIVDAGMGACVQVFAIRSFYRWEGTAQDDPEWRLEVKTSAARLPALLDHITGEHGYDVPEVIATPVVDGNRAYLDWIDEETRQG
ncbi:MAG: divalent cation tolerance protein CutA [Pseudonocardiaceae bacterium]|nr:divalent cation tolerance protein CutA [Pseudonocardiaceae bacterium]